LCHAHAASTNHARHYVRPEAQEFRTGRSRLQALSEAVGLGSEWAV
jgi:hypothetical protein